MTSGMRVAGRTATADPSLVERLLCLSTASIVHQFTRYLVVGSAAFLIDAGSLYFLTEYAGLYYLGSAGIAFVLGLIANYFLSRTWVFNRRTIENSRLEFLVFAMIGVLGLFLNAAVIWFVHEDLRLHYMIAKALSAAIVLVWNFGARKLMLFR